MRLVAGYSLLGRLKERFRVPETTLVFDRGIVSDNNLTLFLLYLTHKSL